MGILSSVLSINKLAALTKAIARAADTIAKSDILRIVWKVIELEISKPAVGLGQTKLTMLLAWAKEAFGLTDAQIDLVEKIAGAAVALFNAVGLFRQLKKG